jgi:hypothetical protein
LCTKVTTRACKRRPSNVNVKCEPPQHGDHEASFVRRHAINLYLLCENIELRGCKYRPSNANVKFEPPEHSDHDPSFVSQIAINLDMLSDKIWTSGCKWRRPIEGKIEACQTIRTRPVLCRAGCYKLPPPVCISNHLWMQWSVAD